MHEFVESLESRRLLSAVSLAVAEARLASDVGTLAANAKQAKGSLISAATTFKADLKALGLKSGPLKSALLSAVAVARAKIQADVTHIITSGFKDGENVVSDVLHITIFNAGNAAKIASYQKKLSADIRRLNALEAPLVAKLTGDVGNAVTKINGAVQAIITASSSDTALMTDWAKLSTAYQLAGSTLVPDLNNVASDLNALTTAS